MRQAMLVYNPTAGRFPSGMLAERAAEVLSKHGWQVQLNLTESGDHITRLARQSAQDGLDGFIVVGGDGSLNMALPGLVGTGTALGALPAGTANVWGQELGLPGLSWTRWLALEESANLLAKSEIRTVDVGLCNGKPFLLWAGVGLDAFIVHQIEPRTRWQKYFSLLQYTASAAWNASLWHGMNLNIQVEGRRLNGHYLLAVVSNIHLYGGGLVQLTPDARLDDGLMDLWLFEGENLGDTIQRLLDLISGQQLHSDRISYHPCRSLSMEAGSPLYVQVDGEPVEATSPVSIEVLPQSLKVFVPPNPPHALLGLDE